MIVVLFIRLILGPVSRRNGKHLGVYVIPISGEYEALYHTNYLHDDDVDIVCLIARLVSSATCLHLNMFSLVEC